MKDKQETLLNNYVRKEYNPLQLQTYGKLCTNTNY